MAGCHHQGGQSHGCSCSDIQTGGLPALRYLNSCIALQQHCRGYTPRLCTQHENNGPPTPNLPPLTLILPLATTAIATATATVAHAHAYARAHARARLICPPMSN